MARDAYHSAVAFLALLLWSNSAQAGGVSNESVALTLLGPCVSSAYHGRGSIRSYGAAGSISAAGLRSYTFPGRWQREDEALDECDDTGPFNLQLGTLFDQQPALDESAPYLSASYRVSIGAWSVRIGGGIIDQVVQPPRYPKQARPFHIGRFCPFFEVQGSLRF